MMTRDELLAMAERAIVATTKGTTGDTVEMLAHIHHTLYAQACVMLAKEMREGERAPTFEQIDRLVDATQNVQWAIQSK